MPRTGRPPLGPKLVDPLDGSPLAKERLTVLLRTITGELQTGEAAEALGCNEARVHALRKRTLQEAVHGLEPRRPGRKPKQVDPKDLEIARLRNELEKAQRKTQALGAQLELALNGVLPRQRSKKRPR